MINAKTISTEINPNRSDLFGLTRLDGRPEKLVSGEAAIKPLPGSPRPGNHRAGPGAPPRPRQSKNSSAPTRQKIPAAGNALRFLILLVALAVGLSGCALFSPGSSASGRAAAKSAHKYVGVPYKLGGKTPKEGFDCSGLVQYVYAGQGVKLPRSSAEQAKKGRKVKKSQLQPGDLVFFSSNARGKVSHVGIYIGNDKFIHAPGRGKKTSKASLSAKYFKKTYHSARRVG